MLKSGEKYQLKITKNTFADYVIFQNSGAEYELALNWLGNFFIRKKNLTKIEFFVLKIHFMVKLAAIHASGSKMTEVWSKNPWF